MDVLGRGALANTAGSFPGSTGAQTFGGSSVNAPYLPGLGISSGAAGLNASFLDATADNTGALFEATTNYLLAKVILASGVKCEGKNPVEVAKLQLNGQDRFTEREGR